MLPCAEERGQAHLPHLELHSVEPLAFALKAFPTGSIAQVNEAQGEEGGLAPALKRNILILALIRSA